MSGIHWFSLLAGFLLGWLGTPFLARLMRGGGGG